MNDRLNRWIQVSEALGALLIPSGGNAIEAIMNSRKYARLPVASAQHCEEACSGSSMHGGLHIVLSPLPTRISVEQLHF
jgi:hypothetical protein